VLEVVREDALGEVTDLVNLETGAVIAPGNNFGEGAILGKLKVTDNISISFLRNVGSLGILYFLFPF